MPDGEQNRASPRAQQQAAATTFQPPEARARKKQLVHIVDGEERFGALDRAAPAAAAGSGRRAAVRRGARSSSRRSRRARARRFRRRARPGSRSSPCSRGSRRPRASSSLGDRRRPSPEGRRRRRGRRARSHGGTRPCRGLAHRGVSDTLRSHGRRGRPHHVAQRARERLAGLAPADPLVERVCVGAPRGRLEREAPAAGVTSALLSRLEQRPADATTARGLGDDEVGNPRLRSTEVEPLPELDVDEADEARRRPRPRAQARRRARGSARTRRGARARPDPRGRRGGPARRASRRREASRRCAPRGPPRFDSRDSATSVCRSLMHASAHRSTISRRRPRSSSSTLRTRSALGAPRPRPRPRTRIGARRRSRTPSAGVQLPRELLDLGGGRLAPRDDAEVDADLAPVAAPEKL